MPYYSINRGKDKNLDVRRKCPVCNQGGWKYQGLLLHLRGDHGHSRREAESIARMDKNVSPEPYGRAAPEAAK